MHFLNDHYGGRVPFSRKGLPLCLWAWGDASIMWELGLLLPRLWLLQAAILFSTKSQSFSWEHVTFWIASCTLFRFQGSVKQISPHFSLLASWCLPTQFRKSEQADFWYLLFPFFSIHKSYPRNFSRSYNFTFSNVQVFDLQATLWCVLPLVLYKSIMLLKSGFCPQYVFLLAYNFICTLLREQFNSCFNKIPMDSFSNLIIMINGKKKTTSCAQAIITVKVAQTQNILTLFIFLSLFFFLTLIMS